MRRYSTEIPRMAADFSLILRHIGLSRNPDAPMRLVYRRLAGAHRLVVALLQFRRARRATQAPPFQAYQ